MNNGQDLNTILNNIYVSILYRNADIREIEYYKNLILKKKLSIQKVHMLLYKSREYIQKNIHYIYLRNHLHELNNFLQQDKKKGSCKCRQSEVNFKIKKSWNSIWYILHSISYSIHTPLDIQKISYCVDKLQLPCEICEEHFKKYKVEHIFPNDRESIINWFIDLHNTINIQNNKKTYTRTEVDVLFNISYT